MPVMELLDLNFAEVLFGRELLLKIGAVRPHAAKFGDIFIPLCALGGIVLIIGHEIINFLISSRIIMQGRFSFID